VPSISGITADSYLQDVQHAKQFLLGETQSLLKNLETQMMAYSNQLEFEKAAEQRDRMTSLSTILHQQSVETTGSDKDADILAVKVQGGKACVNLAMVRGGRHLGDRAYFPVHVQDAIRADKGSSDDGEFEQLNEIQNSTEVLVLEAFIVQHYLQVPVPKVLICSVPIDPKLVAALIEQTGRQTTVIHKPREQRRKWLEMAQKNATIQLMRLLSEEGSQMARTRALVDALELNTEDIDQLRIECFDVSHTSGEATQASCVVFQKHKLQSAEYRRYNIDGITGGDDYAAMRQVLLRRYGKVARADQTRKKDAEETGSEFKSLMPDIVLIDGGIGQISTARAVFDELGLDIGLLVGVEKGEGRKIGLEELVFADGRKKIYLGQYAAAQMLIAQIRDEAHRFAITGMRARRAKVRVGGSQLEDIAGVGPKRRAKLLQRFGGVRGIESASVEEIATVEGVSKELAQIIYKALH